MAIIFKNNRDARAFARWYAKIQIALDDATKIVKLMTSVGNNVAYFVMLDAYDHAKRHYRFFQSVKGGGRVSWHFKKAVEAYKDYESRLLRATENRMFHVDDIADERRRMFGNISDEQYMEFWKGVGGVAYQRVKPFITSLQNKYRLPLSRRGIRDAERTAWVLTASAVLDIAGVILEYTYKDCDEMNIPRAVANAVFGQFSLKKVLDMWETAVYMMEPSLETMELDPIENRNIEIGIEQLLEKLVSPDIIYSSALGSIEDYDEIFATKGFQKKVIREISEARADTENIMEK